RRGQVRWVGRLLLHLLDHSLDVGLERAAGIFLQVLAVPVLGLGVLVLVPARLADVEKHLGRVGALIRLLVEGLGVGVVVFGVGDLGLLIQCLPLPDILAVRAGLGIRLHLGLYLGDELVDVLAAIVDARPAESERLLVPGDGERKAL